MSRSIPPVQPLGKQLPQVQVLSREVYPGPTLADIYDRKPEQEPIPWTVNVTSDPTDGTLRVKVVIPLDG